MKHIEIKTIEHKGISVTVEINYDTGKAAMVTKGMEGFKPKQWQFSHRGLEYMNGWLDIIDAMRVAVLEIKKDLEHDLAEKSAFKEKQILDAVDFIDKMTEPNPIKRVSKFVRVIKKEKKKRDNKN